MSFAGLCVIRPSSDQERRAPALPIKRNNTLAGSRSRMSKKRPRRGARNRSHPTATLTRAASQPPSLQVGTELPPGLNVLIYDRENPRERTALKTGALGKLRGNRLATANAARSFVSSAIFCASMTSPATR
jgi:hypothetical protein